VSTKIAVNGAPTSSKGIRILEVVFEPEAVSKLEMAELSG